MHNTTCKCASDFVKYYRNGNQSVERAFSKSGNKIKQFPPQFCHPLTVGGAVASSSYEFLQIILNLMLFSMYDREL